MSEREELAKRIFIADYYMVEDPHADWEAFRGDPHYVGYVYNIADALLGAGYAKRDGVQEQ